MVRGDFFSDVGGAFFFNLIGWVGSWELDGVFGLELVSDRLIPPRFFIKGESVFINDCRRQTGGIVFLLYQI